MNTRKKNQLPAAVNDDGMIVVRSKDEIPTHFESSDAEAAWWETHELDPETFPMRPARDDLRLARVRAERARVEPGTAPITIRMESDVLERLRRLATSRGLGYQTLLKRFVVERLYEEERRGG